MTFLLRFPFEIIKLVLRILKAAFTGRFGQTENRNIRSRPNTNIRFDVHGQPVHLKVDATGIYCIEMEWINDQDRLDLRLKEFETQKFRRRGMEEIDLSEPALNLRYLVYSNVEPVVVQGLFNWQTRKSLEDIVEFCELSELQVLVNAGKFVVKKRLSIDLERKTADLVRLVISLRNFMVNSRQGSQAYDESAIEDGSIAILNVVDSADEGLVDTECQVCGHKLDHDSVSCITCKTLHHRDCWEYNGCCTTFGCRQNQYQRVD